MNGRRPARLSTIPPRSSYAPRGPLGPAPEGTYRVDFHCAVPGCGRGGLTDGAPAPTCRGHVAYVPSPEPTTDIEILRARVAATRSAVWSHNQRILELGRTLGTRSSEYLSAIREERVAVCSAWVDADSALRCAEKGVA